MLIPGSCGGHWRAERRFGPRPPFLSHGSVGSPAPGTTPAGEARAWRAPAHLQLRHPRPQPQSVFLRSETATASFSMKKSKSEAGRLHFFQTRQQKCKGNVLDNIEVLLLSKEKRFDEFVVSI